MGKTLIIEKGEIKIMEEEFKGATTGVGNRVPPRAYVGSQSRRQQGGEKEG